MTSCAYGLSPYEAWGNFLAVNRIAYVSLKSKFLKAVKCLLHGESAQVGYCYFLAVACVDD